MDHPCDFLICGTAAAEGIPAFFCSCRVCEIARRRAGVELRTRAAYQIGQAVRVDWGPDSYAHAQRFNLRYEHLRHLLMTHTHGDHWLPRQFNYRQPGMAHCREQHPLVIHGNQAIGRSLREVVGEQVIARAGLHFEPVTPFEPIPLTDDAGAPTLEAIALPARHKPDEACVMYLLRIGERWLLQGNDTGWFPDQTWAFLKDFTLDAAVLDSTAGKLPNVRDGHMSAPVVVEAFDALDRQGSLAPGARRVATHFSHNGDMLHDELAAFYAPHGITPAYDGQRLFDHAPA